MGRINERSLDNMLFTNIYLLNKKAYVSFLHKKVIKIFC